MSARKSDDGLILLRRCHHHQIGDNLSRTEHQEGRGVCGGAVQRTHIFKAVLLSGILHAEWNWNWNELESKKVNIFSLLLCHGTRAAAELIIGLNEKTLKSQLPSLQCITHEATKINCVQM